MWNCLPVATTACMTLGGASTRGLVTDIAAVSRNAKCGMTRIRKLMRSLSSSEGAACFRSQNCIGRGCVTSTNDCYAAKVAGTAEALHTCTTPQPLGLQCVTMLACASPDAHRQHFALGLAANRSADAEHCRAVQCSAPGPASTWMLSARRSRRRRVCRQYKTATPLTETAAMTTLCQRCGIVTAV